MKNICNMCGDSLCPNEIRLSGTWSSDEPHGLIDAKVIGGYESYHLLDLNQYTFSFCEKCLRQMFMQCKVKPQVNNMLLPGRMDGYSSLEEGKEWPWEEDLKVYEYRVWKDDGGHHQAYLDRKCNFIKNCPNAAEYTQLISNNFTENCCCENHKDLYNYFNSNLVKFISNILKPFL